MLCCSIRHMMIVSKGDEFDFGITCNSVMLNIVWEEGYFEKIIIDPGMPSFANRMFSGKTNRSP